MRFQTWMDVPSHAMGSEGSSAKRTLPAKSAKVMSSGVFLTMTTTLPTVMRSSDVLSSILTAGGSGGSITAQEKSFSKEPTGARRTRTTPSRKAVMRSFAEPAISSTPSGNLSTRCTLPICCHPAAAAGPPPTVQNNRPIPEHRTRNDMVSLTVRVGGRIIPRNDLTRFEQRLDGQAASHCSKKDEEIGRASCRERV